MPNMNLVVPIDFGVNRNHRCCVFSAHSTGLMPMKRWQGQSMHLQFQPPKSASQLGIDGR